jgi:hypothetical protein
MKRSDLIKNLRAFNKWRRGDETAAMPEPADIGRWIDQACDELRFLDAVLAPVPSLKSALETDDLARWAEQLERERDEALRDIIGWKNKWDCAVEMAARAENHCERVVRERDDLRDRLNDILNQPALKSCKK